MMKNLIQHHLKSHYIPCYILIDGNSGIYSVCFFTICIVLVIFDIYENINSSTITNNKIKATWYKSAI